jgi:hypothetical protein
MKKMIDELVDIEAISPSTVFISGKAFTEQEALDAVSTVLNELESKNNINQVDVAEDTLLGLQRISGKALACLLHGKQEWWDKTGQAEKMDMEFVDYEEKRHGLKRITVERYALVWEKMKEIPKKFQSHPMRDLIPVAKALEQGYEIEKTSWDALIKAASNAEVLHILRHDVKGKKPRKSSMQIYMERDGSLNAWENNEKHFVGYLNVKEEESDKVVKKAIARILGIGVKRR